MAVTAGYICAEPRIEFYRHMDAANVDLKGFTEAFYQKLCTGRLQPVLDTLVYLKRETTVWFEITTLLIPGENDSDDELEAMTQWVVENLGADVPLHFTAFHPDWKMLEWPPTPPATLSRARAIALKNGIRYAYTGNVHDRRGGSTLCHGCGAVLIGRDWYDLTAWTLSADATCPRLRDAAAPASSRARRAPGVGGVSRCGSPPMRTRPRADHRGSASMKFYDTSSAPSPRRVRIFLAEKGIEIPTVQVDLRAGAHLQPEFLKINPAATVPVLELDDGTTISEAIACCRYLEEAYPEPPLMGRDPRRRRSSPCGSTAARSRASSPSPRRCATRRRE